MNEFAEYERRAEAAQAKAAQAFARLLRLAETQDSGQVGRVARFLASTYNGDAYPFDLFELRSVDVDIGDDMLVCLDALRWAKADLYKLVPNGERRVRDVIRDWGVRDVSGEAPRPAPTPGAVHSGDDLQARLVTYGDAPGYRDVNLVLDCEVIGDDRQAVGPVRLDVHLRPADAVRVMQHVRHVNETAWSQGAPIDAQPGEERPPWLG